MADFHPPGLAKQAAAMYEKATAPLVLRSFVQISAFFDGFELVEPGLEGKQPRQKDLAKFGMYAGADRR